MPNIEHPVRTTTRSDGATPIDMNATLFVALELSLTRWVIVASAGRSCERFLPQQRLE